MARQISLFNDNLNSDERWLLLYLKDFHRIDFGEVVYQLRCKHSRAEALLDSMQDRKLIVYVKTSYGKAYVIKENFDRWHREKCGIDDPSIYYLQD